MWYVYCIRPYRDSKIVDRVFQCVFYSLDNNIIISLLSSPFRSFYISLFLFCNVLYLDQWCRVGGREQILYAHKKDHKELLILPLIFTTPHSLSLAKGTCYYTPWTMFAVCSNWTQPRWMLFYWFYSIFYLQFPSEHHWVTRSCQEPLTEFILCCFYMRENI